MLINCVKSAMKEATERIKMGLGLFTKKSILTLMIFFMLRLNLTVFLNNESGWWPMAVKFQKEKEKNET